MFYSQFILAKKGPLGTIWIAAHLERKLRKNQVADTDIGVSVDSILFPDVPIALRLSSHLLLGVVRIYSRKVNYLFDDCSEALLKIKQAFRSTAVDLPPEESTAPYHSITLPETFDLDDFELPDNDIFQGNYVDHHVSTREQITLQDTMEGVVYSTSQFGLDERFGDGDTSQIGLDLDEDLFLDKVSAPGHAGVLLGLDADPQASVHPIIPLQKDVISEATAANGIGNQIEGLAASTDVMEYAQAPSTPGLVEEPNLSSVQEALACDDHLEPEDHNLTELVAKENLENASSVSSLHYGDKVAADWTLLNDTNHDAVLSIPADENGYLLGEQKIKQAKPQGDSPSVAVTDQISSECSVGKAAAPDGKDRAEDMQNGTLSNHGPGILSVDQTHEEFEEPHGLDETVGNPIFSHAASDLEDPCHRECPGAENISEKSILTTSCPPVLECISENDNASLNPDVSASNAACSYESPGRPHLENVEAQALNSVVHEEMPPCSVDVVQACNSHLNQTDLSSLGETSGREEEPHSTGVSTDVQGEVCHATGVLTPVWEENQISIPTSNEHIEADRSKLDEKMDNVISSDAQLLKSSTNSDLPAPEKLLSMPEGLVDPPNDFLVELTPDKVLEGSEGDGAAMKNISGKKRSFTESTLTLHSLNSVETFGVSKSRKTAESIPDDDDLLSSILVGRRSSALKMKPTPPPEVVSMKRPRTATRSNASKRKVLMDDPMVLHGDTIRQQLTSTEDIRRVRKKAPCTRLEIWMIQKQFLEDEIFSEPISTGMSAELMSLYNETYDLSTVRVFENNASSEVAKEMELSVKPNVTKEIGEEGSVESLAVRNDGEVESAQSLVQTENQHGEDHSLGIHDNDTQVKTLQCEFFGEIAEMEIDGQSIAVADASDRDATHGVDSLSTAGPISGDICDLSVGSMVQSTLMEKTSGADSTQLIDELCVSSFNQRLDTISVEKDASAVDSSNGKGVDTIEVAENNNDNIVGIGNESRQKGEPLMEETVGIQTVETGEEVHTVCAAPADNENSSLATVTLEASGCSNLVVVAEDQTTEEIINYKSGIVNDVEVLDAELGYDDKNPTSNSICSEEPKIESSYAKEIDEEMKNAFFNGEENIPLNDIEKPVFLEAESHTVVDTEFTAIDHSAIEDHGDFANITVGHDTEFLNVDDDEVADDDDYMPSAEENRFLENSGWSSRTRAVAKYLQNLFDKEAEHGKKVIPMNNLLAGKTRKEASRMFFETLVLKTRDYIQVEQEKPFDNINVKPRVKLMKSDF
uniref:Sister chromatid cohesion 1 protein 4 n=1 Tax=Vitis vinifera TaxID=29760 RepID=F6H7V8_VITVI|eukprot:XP_010646452.1 PREDICTED: sister chromatid cohesion 1 protein 4 [Vitis vinifera]